MWLYPVKIQKILSLPKVCLMPSKLDNQKWSEYESHSVVPDSLQLHGLYRVHAVLQARILEWVAYFFSSESSRPRNLMGVSCITGGSLPTELSEIMIITILTSPWILQLCLFLNFLFLKSNHEIWVLSCLDCPFSIRFVKFIHVLVCSARHYFSLLYSIPIKTLECIYPFKCWWLYRCISTRGLSWIKFPGDFLYIPFSKHRHLFLLGINTGVEVSGYCR